MVAWKGDPNRSDRSSGGVVRIMASKNRVCNTVEEVHGWGRGVMIDYFT